MANPKMSEVRQPKPRLMLRQARPNLPAGNRKRVRKSHKPGRNITAVAVAFRIGLSVFLPEDHHRDVLALQLSMDRGPIRLGMAAVSPFASAIGVKRRLQCGVADPFRQRPRKPSSPNDSTSLEPSKARGRDAARSRASAGWLKTSDE